MSNPNAFGGRKRVERGNFIRKNDRIRAREVRLIGHDGKQIGIVSRDDAIAAAQKMGLDLVEISANAKPPVCRILEFGKYMYEQSKRQKENRAKSASTSKVKEVKFRVRTEEHDYMTKLRRGEEFLFKGNKLKLSLMFRGRENEHKELGIEVLNKAANDLAHVGHADSPPRLTGRHVSVVMTPLPEHKRTLKFRDVVDNGHEEDDDEDESDED